ncbi:hypothetical protein D9613_012989 [Agrocybe pediades]|uniref:Serine protease n=1 Tax=Agrocybe pediades TaxID=84607 RepID=A0A8H4QEE6_9AGAR|nr:hypothetical protein D9613_012989 [Agrocybe pediades]
MEDISPVSVNCTTPKTGKLSRSEISMEAHRSDLLLYLNCKTSQDITPRMSAIDTNVEDVHQVVDIPSLRRIDLASIHESVVKLSFAVDGQTGVGSAFFVIIPDSPYEVIFTAGHNLYTDAQTFTTEVTVLLPNPNPMSATPISIPIPPENIKVAADYMQDPTNYEADYGVILLPWNGKNPRRGFGFKMTHAFSQLRGEARISSYRDITLSGRPVISAGPILVHECTENQLVYKATTEKGNSGSPVWIPDDTDEIAVVAIHARKPAPGSMGSRGSQLSPKLLREVYMWAGLDTKKKIRAQNTSKRYPVVPPPSGLYMTFEGTGFARLQRGNGTEVDVLPAQVASVGGIKYALGLGKQWVKFSIEDQQAILVNNLVEQCLFTKQTMNNPLIHPHIVYIALEGGYKLRMDGSKFLPHDPPNCLRSGISMTTGHDPFTFEPYIPFTPFVTQTPHDSGHC